MHNWLLIALMALVTFGIRYALFASANTIQLPDKIQQALKYSAPCVLTAIWLPAVMMPNGAIDISFQNAYLVGALIALAIAVWRKNTLLTIVVSMACFFVYKNWLLI